jgi:hypothetical protein
MEYPTAQALDGDVAARPENAPPDEPAGPGTATAAQALPFQRYINGVMPRAVTWAPAAQALVADVAATAVSRLSLPAGRALRLQAVPSQCSARAFLAAFPTAQPSLADVKATPYSVL